MIIFSYKYKRTCFIYNNVWLQFLLLFYMVILLLKYAYIHLGELLITLWNLWLWAMSHWKNTSHVFVSLHHLFQQGRKSQAEAGHFLHCAGKKKASQVRSIWTLPKWRSNFLPSPVPCVGSCLVCPEAVDITQVVFMPSAWSSCIQEFTIRTA